MAESARKDTLNLAPADAKRARAAIRLLADANALVEARHEWLLESLVDRGKQLRRMPIAPLPFRIGRMPGLDLVLPSQLVSKEHAEIYEGDEGLRLRDLESTNGTFVNRQPADDVPLCDGDIIHFADFEFRLGRVERVAAPKEGAFRPITVSIGPGLLPH